MSRPLLAGASGRAPSSCAFLCCCCCRSSSPSSSSSPSPIIASYYKALRILCFFFFSMGYYFSYSQWLFFVYSIYFFFFFSKVSEYSSKYVRYFSLRTRYQVFIFRCCFFFSFCVLRISFFVSYRVSLSVPPPPLPPRRSVPLSII